MDFNTRAAEQPEIQSMVSNGDSAPREDPAIVAFDQSEATRLPVEEVPLALAQSATPDLRTDEDVLNQLVATYRRYSLSESKRISAIQVALALFAASLVLMLAMPGGMDKRGRVILGNTISFNVYLVTDMLALVASLAVAIILAFDQSGKIISSMEIILGVAAASFLSALLAAGFVLEIRAVKWIMVSFVGAGAMVVAVLIYRAFNYPKSNTPLTIQMSQQHQILNALNAV